MINSLKRKKGFSLVEIVIASALISLIGTFVFLAIQGYIKMAQKSSKQTQVALLLEETAEALQLMRDQDWENLNSLNLNTEYYLVWSENNYYATTTPSLVYGTFARKFILGATYRNSNSVISESGDLDEDTLRANIIISWDDAGTEQEFQAESLIHNLYEN